MGRSPPARVSARAARDLAPGPGRYRNLYAAVIERHGNVTASEGACNMNHTDLIEAVSRDTGLDGDQVAAALDAFLQLLAREMSTDEANSLFGFTATVT